MNQSNNNVNPLEFYRPFSNVIGRDVYNPIDETKKKYETEVQKKKKAGRQNLKEDQVLNSRRYTRLTEKADLALQQIASEQGIEVATLIRVVLMDYLEKSGKLDEE